MNKLKMLSRGTVVVLLMVVIAGSCISYGLTYYANSHYRSGIYIVNETHFTPGHKTNDKWAKSTWSKISEGSKSAYKSTKTLTSSQAKSSKTGMQYATVKKVNNPLKKQKYTHGYKYL